MTDMNLVGDEIRDALNAIAEKHFLSTWVCGFVSPNDSGSSFAYNYSGSKLEAAGLAGVIHRDYTDPYVHEIEEE